MLYDVASLGIIAPVVAGMRIQGGSKMIDPSQMFGWIVANVAKVPTKVLFAIFIASAAFLFLPDGAMQAIQLEGTRRSFGWLAGMGFFFSAVLLSVYGTIGFHSWWKRRQAQAKWLDRVIRAINRLDDSEIALLREFTIQGQNTIRAPIDHPVVAGLLGNGVICQASTIGHGTLIGMVFPIRLTETAEMFVSAELLGMPEPPTDLDRRRVAEERPEYILEVLGRERMTSRIYR